MNVELPDGTVIEDVPDGTTKDQLRSKLQANGYDMGKLDATQAPAAPTQAPSPAAPPEPSLRETITKAAQGVFAPLTYAQDTAAGLVKDLGVGAAKGVAELGTLGDRLAYRAGLYKYHKPETTPTIDRMYEEAGPAAAVTRAVLPAVVAGPVSRFGAVADIAANAGLGAIEGYANGEDPLASGLKAGAGASAGRALPLALRAASVPVRGAVNRLTSGIRPEAQALLDAGITPTPGQAMGPGIVAALEGASKHLPGYGGAVQKAQLRTGEQYAAREVADAMSALPNAPQITEQGLAAVRRANDMLKQSYEQVVPLTHWTPQSLDAAVQVSRGAVDHNPLMNDAQRAGFNGWVNQNVQPLLDAAAQQGTAAIPGRLARDLDIQIGALVRKFNGANPETHALADAFSELQKNLRGALDAANPQVKAQLEATNAAFANMIPVATAFDRAGGKIPTPDQFRRAAAKGGALDISGGKLNDAAMEVIDPRRSGGLTRSVASVASLGHPLAVAGVGALAGIGHALYSERGVKLMLGAMNLMPNVRQWVDGLPLDRQIQYLQEMVKHPHYAQMAAQVGRQLASQQAQGATP
ncbi:hypothetical protein QTI17_17265 [Variovorax sp. J31P179]|uniref:hypothetical protein n=1 Tax=Variovorax sp. J31P179 TaxID=3053508 RepID=UPI00257737BA|nr:hypothetical protein [Variovorax sp. J31P179]MDM0082345.1 hypothetical protein [Variovorax sp. J31P179]